MNNSTIIANVTTLMEQVAALQAQIAEMSKSSPKNRGPKSESTMTEEHAFRCKFGDLKDGKHKDVAVLLGLSYGQIFSCRGGYTFKQVKADWVKPTLAAVAEPATQE